MADSAHRLEALQMPDSYLHLSKLHSASHYFLSRGMLVEAMTAAATLAGICLTDKLMSIVVKQEHLYHDEWVFSMKDIIKGAMKVLSMLLTTRAQ